MHDCEILRESAYFLRLHPASFGAQKEREEDSNKVFPQLNAIPMPASK